MLVIFFIGIAVIVTGALWLTQPSHEIEVRGNAVADASKWGENASNAGPPYFWLTNTELLTVEMGSWHLALYDLKSRRYLDTAALNRIVSASGFRPWRITVSPIDRHVLWGAMHRRLNDRFVTVSIHSANPEGRQVVNWPKHTEIPTGWFANGRQWYSFGIRNTVVYRLDAPRDKQLIPTDSRNEAKWLPWPNWVGTEIHTLRHRRTSSDSSTIEVLSTGLQENKTTEQTYVHQFPMKIDRLSACYSPDGRKMAYTVGYLRGTIWPNWLTDLAPRIFPHRDLVEGIWETKIDGSDLHELVYHKASPTNPYGFYSAAWSPDGKRISLIYKRKLWLLNIE